MRTNESHGKKMLTDALIGNKRHVKVSNFF
jgi:hypothetical protein